MAGLDHDFLLVSRREFSAPGFFHWINSPKAIQIHDDVIRYVQDTLNWITCYNPGRRMTKQKGLNLCGPTIIKSDGAPCAEAVFAAWAKVFSNGPKKIQLTGAYEWIDGDSGGSGRYSKIKVDRDEIVAKFTAIANYARKVGGSKNEFLILHMGI